MLYFEVEVVEAKGSVSVGFAGASFHEAVVGCGVSWGVDEDGMLGHRQAPRVPSSPMIRVSAVVQRNVHQDMYNPPKQYTRQGDIHQPPGTRLASKVWHGSAP